jgi:hypothetical protein
MGEISDEITSSKLISKKGRERVSVWVIETYGFCCIKEKDFYK